MSLVYNGVPGLDIPGGAVPGLAYIPAAPPAVLRRGVVAITASGPVAAAVTISASGPLAAAASIAAAGPLAAQVTISQPS